MEHELKRKDGVREKKRRDMHRRITEIGLKLFAENGYEATTLDAIAEASGIARRTFFHYFRSKEEIILAWQNALPCELHAEILKQRGAASPITTTQAALVALAVNMRPDVAVLIGRIVQSTEQLQSGNQAKFLRMEQAAYEGLCELWPDVERRFGLRLAAMICVGAMRLSIDAWVAEGCQRLLVEHLEANFGCLKTELGAC
ncbi:TetR family transcriptional regulator [Pectobacterium peruviense]|uniref:TetR/AcrR family transcriptional regulator n=1 Tax=Pectobacterium peruviense TaxID=2066479 RepID=UPI000C7CD6C3|nr:TetR/AcrR family transcriptional regulator [Pectobacterium peruviense]PKX81921.1 TetR family transcriptional regulator [Pectobacterium peruviense]